MYQSQGVVRDSLSEAVEGDSRLEVFVRRRVLQVGSNRLEGILHGAASLGDEDRPQVLAQRGAWDSDCEVSHDLLAPHIPQQVLAFQSSVHHEEEVQEGIRLGDKVMHI